MAGQPSKEQLFISKITDIVLANLSNEKFGVKELIQISGISRRILAQRLRAINNKSINQFIRETRLQKALEMLKNGKVTASEVAYKVGFGSPAYFNTCFNEFFGFTPGQVKKEILFDNSEIKPAEFVADLKQKKRAWRAIIPISAVTLVLVVLSWLASNFFSKNPSVNALQIKNSPDISIAVLPFENLSDSSSNKYFIDGIMNELLADLGKIHRLRVASRTSVEQFRGSKISTTEIAKKLNVVYIVEASGQKYGNSVRLRVQLIDALKDRQIWADQYGQEIREVKDIFKIQSQVAKDIASKLKMTITPEEKQLIDKIPTSSLTAYDFYQRGLEALQKYGIGGLNKESVKRAEVLFRRALENDSTFALAYTGLAEVCWKKYYIENNLTIYLDSVLIYANMALSYDAQLAEAYFDRAGYYDVKGSRNQILEEYDNALRYNPNDWIIYWGKGIYYEDYDIIKSITNFQMAASLNHGPQLTEALRRVGDIYYQIGLPEKGNHFLLEALKLDGDSAKYSLDIIIYEAEASGDYNKVLAACYNRVLTDSANANILLRIGFYNSLIGNYKESLKYFKKYISLINTGAYCYFWTKLMEEYLIGYAYKENGLRRESDYYFESSIEVYSKLIRFDRPGENRDFYYRLAGIFSYRGDRLKAYEYLHKFGQSPIFSAREIILIKHDPLFRTIRNEPEFQKIVRDMESKYQAEHERVRKWLDDQREL